jgi:hypothetical protein
MRPTAFRFVLATSVYFLGSLWSQGTQVVIPPSADTSLIELVPDNNLGGERYLLVGTSENLTRHRAILKFNIAAALPAGAKVTSVQLSMEVTQVPQNGDPIPSNFEVHRLLRDWGEGNKVSPTNCTSCGGLGVSATLNEASWSNRFSLTTNSWGAGGAQEAVDYVTETSSDQFIYTVGLSPYLFSSSDRAVADVQGWLENPTANFGWLIKSSSEDTAFTARRLGSRENTNFSPLLYIDFIAPPILENASVSGNTFSFTFSADAGQAYVVERCAALAATNSWTLHTNVPAQPDTAAVVISDLLLGSPHFYRVSAP